MLYNPFIIEKYKSAVDVSYASSHTSDKFMNCYEEYLKFLSTAYNHKYESDWDNVSNITAINDYANLVLVPENKT